MKRVLIIGSGIAGLSCAVSCAELGMHAELVSPFPSERAQSVMAAGGINAVPEDRAEGDSVACHIEDTLKGGAFLAGPQAVTGLCRGAADILSYLEKIGTVFSLDEEGRPARRAFGGQSFKRTYYCGSSTGKQIVSALVMEARRYEAAGMIRRRLWTYFHSALIRDGVCCGAMLFDQRTGGLEAVLADALVMATGGQNALFGKTTGSTLCDGYAQGRLLMQGVDLKNLEFVQFHPTTLETGHKRMLVSEAARGEGGRLFYMDRGRRVYFMEDKYGPRGNLMTRDLVSKEIFLSGKEVFLDLSFLDRKIIDQRLPEVRDLCSKYRGIDIAKDPIPVAPSVHFFMGGIAVHLNHETKIRGLFAIGECASMYHGANRLGGNSLLAALYSGGTAAREIAGRESAKAFPDFEKEVQREEALLAGDRMTESRFPVMYIRDMAAETMQKHFGIVRTEEDLKKGMEEMDYYLYAAERIHYDRSVMPYFNYSLTGILTLARASFRCALERKESRGAHCRSDFPDTDPSLCAATLISCRDGDFEVRLDRERSYES